MKKWYQWISLAFIFAVSGILNYFVDRQIVASIIQVGISLSLAFVQYFCDKKGERGKKVFRYVSIVVLILLVIWEITLVAGI